MIELSHDQVRRQLQAAVDGQSSAESRAALRAHLDVCPKCQAYAAEFNWLHRALYRAWRARWHTRRSLADMSSRVLASARREIQRKLFFGFANAFARVGTLIVVVAFVVGSIQNQNLQPDNSANGSASANDSFTTRFDSKLPAFELESDNVQPLPSNGPVIDEDWHSPGLINRLSNTPILQ